MKILLLSVTVVSSLLMVGIILLQQGKGAGLGSAFGGGSRGGLYETSGKASLLSRTTAVLAVIFLSSSLALSLFLGQDTGVLEELNRPAESITLPEETTGDAETEIEQPPAAAADQIPE